MMGFHWDDVVPEMSFRLEICRELAAQPSSCSYDQGRLMNTQSFERVRGINAGLVHRWMRHYTAQNVPFVVVRNGKGLEIWKERRVESYDTYKEGVKMKL